MKTRDQIIAENPVEDYCASIGIVLKGNSNERMAKCPFHEDGSPSFSVNIGKQLWTCRAGCGGGSVIDLMARHEGVSVGTILNRLGETPEGFKPPVSKAKPKTAVAPAPTEKPKIVKTYDYRNAAGELVYQALRLEPKSFRQRRPDGTGKWYWNMEGVERVLYQFPQLLKTHKPWCYCEGEKDADNVTALGGWLGTTHVGGSKSWLDAYADFMAGRDIILCGDTDEPGKEMMQRILSSLAGKAKSVTVVKIPDPHKDVTDWLNTLPDDMEQRHNAFAKLVDDSPCYDKGLDIPVQSMAEMELEMRRSVETAGTRSFTFEGWLPGLASVVRPIVPGEIITIIAATKVGKTFIGQAISRHAAPLKVLYFSQELPSSLMFERYAASVTGLRAVDVYHTYKQGGTVDWRGTGQLDHIYCCPKTRITPEQIKELLKKSELKIGEEVALWVVDYAQLAGGAKDRYDRVADLMEGCKAVAKETKTIGVILSQKGRGDKGEDDRFNPVYLGDGKHAGEIENSSGLILGAWRTDGDETALNLEVLANTKGLSGKQIVCNFDGARGTITERSQISDQDVPVQPQETTVNVETVVVPESGMPYKD